MNYFAIGLLTIITYICIYSIINRICTCIEKSALAKTFDEFLKSESEKKGDEDDGI